MPLSRVGSYPAASKLAGGVQYENRCNTTLHFTHTLSGQPDGDSQQYTLALPLGLYTGPANEAALSTGT